MRVDRVLPPKPLTVLNRRGSPGGLSPSGWVLPATRGRDRPCRTKAISDSLPSLAPPIGFLPTVRPNRRPPGQIEFVSRETQAARKKDEVSITQLILAKSWRENGRAG